MAISGREAVSLPWVTEGQLILVFFFFMIPEMKGLTLEEIDECFENKIATRKFKEYRPVSGLRAAEVVEWEKASATVEVQLKESLVRSYVVN
jgi:hypothetical protein